MSNETFAGSVLWPGVWIIHPTANASCFLGKRNTTLLQTLWRSKYSSAITGRVNEAEIPSPQMIFFTCVNTTAQKQKCLWHSVCLWDRFVASGEAAFAFAVPPAAERVFAGGSPGWRVFPTAGDPLQPLRTWISPSLRAFPGDGTREQHRRSVDHVLKLCFMFSLSKSEHVLGYTLEDDTNSGVAVTLNPHFTCVREGPEQGGSSSLIIQYCSRLFAN